MIARDHGLSTRYSVTSLKVSARTAVVPTCVAPLTRLGRKPTPAPAAAMPRLGKMLPPEGWTTGLLGLGLLGTLGLGPPG